MRNTFGNIFTLTTFGESHGAAVGGVVDGFPAGIDIDMEFIQNELNRRRPGQSKITTSRNEADSVELLSGVFEGKSTGCPIGFIVRNTNQHSNDYDNMKNLFRPSHADYTYYKKYGIRDHRGGGRSSARITISRCVAGALAKLALKEKGITINAYTSQVGNIKLDKEYDKYDLQQTESYAVRCPDPTKAKEMEQLIAQLAYAMLGINAVKGIEFGIGFDAATKYGSEINDVFYNDNGTIKTRTNNSGGIQGGISNGNDIYFNIAFKPVATILMEQQSVDKNGQETTFKAHGRHDPCVLPRAVPIVEAMAAMVILNDILAQNTTKL